MKCKHCSVNNITAVVHPYEQIRREMQQLYDMGIRILFFCGGETFLWRDGERTLRDLVVEAKEMGFLIVNVVTNGTFPIDLPEADLILLSLDGDRERHNAVRGDTYDTIMENIKHATSDNVTPDVLRTLKTAGVTKISIGIQSFQTKFQSVLGRTSVDISAMKQALSEVPFETVSMDFIFALPNQTFEDLKADVDAAFQSGANHVAIYPFIDFTFTPSTVTTMPKKEKRELLDAITRYCMDQGYTRSSIWTFSSEADARYSSMTRDNFLGFGCSATTLLKDQFKINTFSVEEYCNRIAEEKLPTSLTLRFTLRQRMIYYLFWTAYSTKVAAGGFEKFFGVPLKKMYGAELKLAKLMGFVTEENGVYSMTLKGAFYYHYYENFYTLSYIDKMWGVMRKEAFPQELTLG